MKFILKVSILEKRGIFYGLKINKEGKGVDGNNYGPYLMNEKMAAVKLLILYEERLNSTNQVSIGVGWILIC
jgi:hypothetical protein